MWWSSGILLLICLCESKTIKTNEISMPSLGHKEETAVFRRLQPIEIIQPKHRSLRFERLRAIPENNVKPVFVKPATIESEEPMFASSPPSPIEVIPSMETVTEIPLESLPTSEIPETPETTTEAVTTVSHTEVPIKTAPETVSPVLVETTDVPAQVIEFGQERVYPTAVSITPTIEFVEVMPSTQVEVSSAHVDYEITTTSKAPKKRRLRRKHRKLRKITKATEAPTEATESTEASTTIELQTEPSTTPVTVTTSTIPLTIPTSGSPVPKLGESYLGGWNEDEGVIVTTSGPSLGTAINQFSELPSTISIDDDKAVKAYYEQYYAEWYQKHNQASVGTPESFIPVPPVPQEVKIKLAQTTVSPLEVATQPIGITSSTAQPTKEQLDKVCDYVAKISKSFGIKDLVGFAKNNCSFVQSFHPATTCEQIQSLMQYCVTGVLEK